MMFPWMQEGKDRLTGILIHIPTPYIYVQTPKATPLLAALFPCTPEPRVAALLT